MSFTAQDVKKLRDATGVGMMDAQKALTEANGHLEQAMDILRKSSAKLAAKKLDREAKDGLIVAYIHPGNKIGVLLEINCETDFVARTEDFNRFCQDIALHIAAAAPTYLGPEHIPAEILDKEREIYLAQLEADPKDAGKPKEIKDKIIQGRIDKFIAENCLLSQAFIKDDSRTITQVIEETTAKVGEKIKIGRFTRYTLGA